MTKNIRNPTATVEHHTDRRPRNWWSFISCIGNRNNSQEPDSETRDRKQEQSQINKSRQITRVTQRVQSRKEITRERITSVPKNNFSIWLFDVVVVVVVDPHIQRIVLATEETAVSQQVSHRPIKCQSRLWSQRGTKVNGSHHGDNPLLRPTGIQIATKSYAALQAMAPTNIETGHQTSLLHIESIFDRLGMLSPTHDQRSQQKTGKITLQPVLINKSIFLEATHCTEIRKNEIPKSMVVEALSW